MVFNSFKFPGVINTCEKEASSFCGAANSKPRRQICKTKAVAHPSASRNQEMLKDEGGTIQADQGSSLQMSVTSRMTDG